MDLFSSNSRLLACPILPLSLSPFIFPCNLCIGSNCEDSSLVVIPQLCPKFKCCQIDNNVIACSDCQGFCPKWDLPLIMIYDAECQSLVKFLSNLISSSQILASVLNEPCSWILVFVVFAFTFLSLWQGKINAAHIVFKVGCGRPSKVWKRRGRDRVRQISRLFSWTSNKTKHQLSTVHCWPTVQCINKVFSKKYISIGFDLNLSRKCWREISIYQSAFWSRLWPAVARTKHGVWDQETLRFSL